MCICARVSGGVCVCVCEVVRLEVCGLGIDSCTSGWCAVVVEQPITPYTPCPCIHTPTLPTTASASVSVSVSAIVNTIDEAAEMIAMRTDEMAIVAAAATGGTEKIATGMSVAMGIVGIVGTVGIAETGIVIVVDMTGAMIVGMTGGIEIETATVIAAVAPIVMRMGGMMGGTMGGSTAAAVAMKRGGMRDASAGIVMNGRRRHRRCRRRGSLKRGSIGMVMGRSVG